MTDDRIWIYDHGEVRSALPTSPAKWHGETECVVGPFSNEAAARNFSQVRRPSDLARQRTFVRGNSWYVELTPGSSKSA